MEDLPEDEGMDDLDLGLEEALQGTFASQTIATTDEKVDEGRDVLLFKIFCMKYSSSIDKLVPELASHSTNVQVKSH